MQPGKAMRRAIVDRSFDPKNLVKNVGIPVGIAISAVPLSGCLKDTMQPSSASQPVATQVYQDPNYDLGRSYAAENRAVEQCYSEPDPTQCIRGYNDQLRAAPAIPSTAQQAQDLNTYQIPGSQPALTENPRLERWKERASTAATLARDLYRDIRTEISTTSEQVPSRPMMQADLGYNDPANVLNQADTLGNFTVTQAINENHPGIDFAYSRQNGNWPDTTGAPIYALPGAPSEVTCNQDFMGGTNATVYQPGSDIAFLHIHLDSCLGQSDITSTFKQTVEPGTQIGTIGNTGTLSRGPHLHTQPSRITPGETVNTLVVADTTRLLPLTRQTAEYILGVNPQQ